MNPLQNLYDEVDVLKDGKHGKISLVYDKVGKQVCVTKERSLQSAELYSRLQEIKNPYLPEIYRAVKFGGVLFVVEEFVEGQTLAEILTYHGTVSEELAAQILKQLCAGLKLLHEKNIIHRDIKPSNIMLTKNNSVRLIDCGISRIAKTDSEMDTDFLGTRGYAPPEQFGFGQTDARSDIFSLGVTMQKILGENYSGYLKKVLKKCTALDPAKRYQTVEELFSDIDKKFYLHRLKKVFANLATISAVTVAVLFFPTNFFETETETPIQKVTEQKKSAPPKSPAPKNPDKTFEFPEIKFPDAGKITPETFELPQIETPETSETPTDPRLKKFCTVYLGGKIFSADVAENVWQSWRQSGDKIFFPADWNLTLQVENKNNFALTNLQIAISLQGDVKNFSAEIPAHSAKTFSVALGNYFFSGESFSVEIRADSDDENVFAWQDKSFGNYRDFKIYLRGFAEWNVKHLQNK